MDWVEGLCSFIHQTIRRYHTLTHYCLSKFLSNVPQLSCFHFPNYDICLSKSEMFMTPKLHSQTVEMVILIILSELDSGQYIVLSIASFMFDQSSHFLEIKVNLKLRWTSVSHKSHTTDQFSLKWKIFLQFI